MKGMGAKFRQLSAAFWEKIALYRLLKTFSSTKAGADFVHLSTISSHDDDENDENSRKSLSLIAMPYNNLIAFLLTICVTNEEQVANNYLISGKFRRTVFV